MYTVDIVPVYFEFVSWLPVAGQCQCVRRAVLGVQLHVSQLYVAEPAARHDAARHSAPPAVPLSTEFLEPSTGGLVLLNASRPVCSVTATHPTRPKLDTCKRYKTCARSL